MLNDANESHRLNSLNQYNILDTPPEECFDRITHIVKASLNVPIALVSLVDNDRQWFKSRQGLDVQSTPREISFCTHAIKHDAPMIISDTLTNPQFMDNSLVTGPPAIRAYMGAPLTTPDGFNLGTLCAIDTKPRDFSQDQIELLEALAGMVMRELELRNAAMSDSLTGLPNRRAFYNHLQRTIAGAHRYGRSLSVVSIDIDHFKKVNDTYGHAAGDRTIQTVCARCESVLRASDFMGRVGGEEFAIILSETSLNSARQISERIRNLVECTTTEYDAHDIRVTVSLGVAELAKSDDIYTFMARADEALYNAKNSGRNRVVCSPIQAAAVA